MYVVTSENVIIPGRVSTNTYRIEPPGTFYLAGSIFFFASTLILLTLKQEKYNKLPRVLFLSCFVLLGVSFFYGVK